MIFTSRGKGSEAGNAGPTPSELAEDAVAPAPPPRSQRRPLSRALQLGALALVAALLALLLWRVLAAGHGASLVKAVKQGKRPAAPGFALPVLWAHDETWPRPLGRALRDGHISLAELRGYPVVINFWASWCIPCKKEAPRLAASARAHAGKVVFLGIDIQDFASDGRRFLRGYQANYVSVRDGGSATSSAYGLTGVPETYYLDARGRIAAHSIGEISRRALEQGISAAEGDAR